VSSFYSSLPPMFRPRKGRDVAIPYSVSKVPEAPATPPAKVEPLSYSFPWPDEVEGLGRLHIGPFDRCAKCGAGSWVRYGATVLCIGCARPAPRPSTPGSGVPVT
jgi:hypothetical protein